MAKCPECKEKLPVLKIATLLNRNNGLECKKCGNFLIE